MATRQVIVAASAEAGRKGIWPGMTLAQARAVCADVEHAPWQAEEDRKSLEALGRWMMRFTPVVALCEWEMVHGSPGTVRENNPKSKIQNPKSSPPALLLDLTGCERVFNGIANIILRVREAMAGFGFAARIAVAPTVGAAWAMAYGGGERRLVTDPAELAEVLADLPVEALRLEESAAAGLRHLGLERIGQVMRMPRDAMPARFGELLLRRIDQAMGVIAEPIVGLAWHRPIRAGMEFDGVVESQEAIWLVFKDLVGQIIRELERRGCGVRKLEMRFLRPYASPIDKTICLSRPTRDAANLLNLFRCALETVHAEEGFLGLKLAVSLMEKLPAEQLGLLTHRQSVGEQDLAHLIERLHVRLGPQSLAQADLVESHIPEKAYALRGVRESSGASVERTERGNDAVGEKPEIRNQNDESPRRSRLVGNESTLQSQISNPTSHISDLKSQISDLRSQISTLKSKIQNPKSKISQPGPPRLCGESFPPIPNPPCLRPLLLLPTPVEIRVMVSPSHDRDGRPVSFWNRGASHRLTQAVGPERIDGQWWEGHNKTRDYFDATDETGRRFWLFRVMQTGKWYLHGLFE